ncbi:MAG: ABC transporter ATP-binding protein [Actinomycetota bacterium]
MSDAGNAEVKPMAIVRRGLELSPEFRPVIGLLVGLGVLIGLGRVAIPVLFQQLIDDDLLTASGFDGGRLTTLALITLAVVIAVGGLSVASEIVLIRTAEGALARLRQVVVRRAVDLSLEEHSVERQGDLVSRTTGDIEALTRFVDWGAYAWLVNTSIALTATVAMFVYSWQLALVAVAMLVLMVPVLISLQREQQRRVLMVRERTGDLLSEANEAIAGAHAVRAFGQRRSTRARLDEDVDELYRTQVFANRVTAVLFTISDIFGTIAIGAVILAAVWLGVDGPSLGTTIAVIFLVQMTLVPIAELTEVIDQTSLALAGWERTIDLANRPQAIPPAANPQPIRSGALEIDVANVDFAYGENQVLHDVSVSIPAGTAVAVVGATGSGKTTLARLLCRLADPAAGSISLGGVDVRRLSDADRRRSVRMVPQDGFLFATTVRANVLMGRDNATDTDLDQVVADLGLTAWVTSLPDGLDTDIGPAGDGLSVGERQLVAVMRAALADPGVLILDEATSSLDPATELAMTEALDRLKRGRTTVTVAHRLSTAERADLVVVFDHGRVVGIGPHAELVAAGGVYADLYAAWTRGASI